LVGIFSMGWIGRRRLIDDLELAQEQACDQRAAQVIGDPIAVAETLVQCQRLAQAPRTACAFFRGQLPQRVQALLEPSFRALSPLTALRFGSLAVLVAMSLAIPLHYFIEFL
jgi:beta-lactamase regulating signal transducer with metallopeptidase domain